MKKIAVLALVLVVCLSALGVGYAKWTDDIVIDGKVETGSVDIEIGSFFSGTYVYKNLETHALVVYGPNPAPDPTGLLLVGSAYAEPNPYHEEVVMMTWDNLFPTCFPWKADAQFHYVGTIPGKVADIIVEADNPESEWILPYLEIKMKFMKPPPNNTEVVVGTQLHNCDWVSLVVTVDDLPQADEMMSRCAAFTIRIVVEQWAECFPK